MSSRTYSPKISVLANEEGSIYGHSDSDKLTVVARPLAAPKSALGAAAKGRAGHR